MRLTIVFVTLAFYYYYFRSKGDSDKQEVLSLVSAIKDVNLSKLLSKDTTVMFTLLQQFFGTELVNKVDELQRNSLLQVSYLLANNYVPPKIRYECVHVHVCVIARVNKTTLGNCL